MQDFSQSAQPGKLKTLQETLKEIAAQVRHTHTLDSSKETSELRTNVKTAMSMANRIANIDEGSYPGTFKYYEAMGAAAGDQLWVPAHGEPRKDLLKTYGSFLQGIWEPCLAAVKDGKSEAEAKAMVLADPRVAARARSMQGFDSNIGKYTSLAYLEAEKEAF